METEKREYTLRECMAYNEERRELASGWIKGNHGRDYDTPRLELVDDPNPCNVLHDAIRQFYSMGTTYYRIDEAVKQMRREVAECRRELCRTEPTVEALPTFLQELLERQSPEDWADALGDVLEALILSVERGDGALLQDALHTVLTLQRFFQSMKI